MTRELLRRERDPGEAQPAEPAPPVPLLELQRGAGNAAVARMILARQETATATAAATAMPAPDPTAGIADETQGYTPKMQFDVDKAVKINWAKYEKKAQFVRQCAWFVDAPLAPWLRPGAGKPSPYELAFADKLAEYQKFAGLPVTGALDKETEAALKARSESRDEEGMTWQQRMQDTDFEQLDERAEASEDAREGADVKAKRDAIVAAATGEIGKVLDENRGDGKKYGAERLKAYYREAYPGYSPQGFDEGIETPGLFPGNTKATGKSRSGAWSWCAIFGVWAIKQGLGVGAFAGEPIGLGQKIDKPADAKPGDLICRHDDPGKDPLNHQCVVVKNDGKSVTTVNGNGNGQSVYMRTEPIDKYHGYYSIEKALKPAEFDAKVKEWREKAAKAAKKKN